MLLRKIAEYFAVAAFTLLCAFAVMNLWRADLRIPFEFHGDGLLHATMVKTVVEKGWVTTNHDLGVPGYLDFRDFPAYDNLQVALIRVMAIFSSDPLLLLNLFFLLTFPLTAVIAYGVMRRLAFSRASSFFVAVLFALAPYHFRRGVGHLFLASYYLVPVAFLVATHAARGVMPALSRGHRIALVVALIALSCNGGYYPFFSGFLFAIAGIIGVYRVGSWRGAAPAAASIAIVLGGLVLNALPVTIHEMREGDLDAHYRAPIEGDVYGFKFAQLILPIANHRISDFARTRAIYNTAPLTNENDIASIGLVASIGFLLLLWQLLFRTARDEFEQDLASMNGGLLLFGIVGGIGALFSLLVWSQIRGYNRVSIFIMFLGLVAVARAFDRRFRGRGAAVAAFLIAILGGAEQTSRTFAYFGNDPAVAPARAFTQRVVATVPPGSAIFQLPYHRFPEAGRQHELTDYEHFRPYLLSEGVRWSYGAVKESRGDQYQRWISTLPIEEQLSTLATAGFSAVWIDRRGYEDNGAAVERIATDLLNTPAEVSEDGRYSFFPLAYRAWFNRQQWSAGEWRKAVDVARKPVLIHWSGGFTGAETDGGEIWAWSSHRGVIVLTNDRETPMDVRLDFDIEVARPQQSTLQFRGLINRDLLWKNERIHISEHVSLKPGRNELTIISDARRAPAAGDTRVLVFRVIGLTIHEEGRFGHLRKAS